MKKKTDAAWVFALKAVDEGLTGKALKSRVSELMGRPAPISTGTHEQIIRTARAAVAGQPCDGTLRSRAFRLFLKGASDEIVAEALQTSFKVVATLRTQACWVAPQAAASPRARARASASWVGQEKAPSPLRRERRLIWEVVRDAIVDGQDDLDEIVAVVQDAADAHATRDVVSAIHSQMYMAKIALDGHVDDGQFNRVSRALISGLGNQEVARKCRAPVNVVAGIRLALRRIDPRLVAVDPTKHLQPAQADALPERLAVGDPEESWGPPRAGQGHRATRRPQTGGVAKQGSVPHLAREAILAGMTGDEVMAHVLRVHPKCAIDLKRVASYRFFLRKEFGEDRVPSDAQARATRGLQHKTSRPHPKRQRALDVSASKVRRQTEDA